MPEGHRSGNWSSFQLAINLDQRISYLGYCPKRKDKATTRTLTNYTLCFWIPLMPPLWDTLFTYTYPPHPRCSEYIYKPLLISFPRVWDTPKDSNPCFLRRSPCLTLASAIHFQRHRTSHHLTPNQFISPTPNELISFTSFTAFIHKTHTNTQNSFSLFSLSPSRPPDLPLISTLRL